MSLIKPHKPYKPSTAPYTVSIKKPYTQIIFLTLLTSLIYLTCLTTLI